MSATRRWVRHPQPSPRGAGFALGVCFVLAGVVLASLLAVNGPRIFGDDTATFDWVIIVGIGVLGVPLLWRGVRKGRHAAWLRSHGEERSARVVSAQRTGVEIGDVPVFRLTLEVRGPSGAYTAYVDEVLPPEDVNLAVGANVRVRASPREPRDVMLEAVESPPTPS